MTFENDDYKNTSNDDRTFKQSLRPLTSGGLNKKLTGMNVASKDKLSETESQADEKNKQEMEAYDGHPPAFADSDMDKWLNKKFKNALDQHKNARHLQEKRGFKSIEGSNGLGNQNSLKYKQLLRRNDGRQTTCAFTNVDFDCAGNTAMLDDSIR